jgi:hypothetical protein
MDQKDVFRMGQLLNLIQRWALAASAGTPPPNSIVRAIEEARGDRAQVFGAEVNWH